MHGVLGVQLFYRFRPIRALGPPKTNCSPAENVVQHRLGRTYHPLEPRVGDVASLHKRVESSGNADALAGQGEGITYRKEDPMRRGFRVSICVSGNAITITIEPW